MRTLGDLKWLLTAVKSSPPLEAGTLLYLHGVRVSSSIRLKVDEVTFSVTPAMVRVGESRSVYVTDELANALRELAAGKSGDDLLLGYSSVLEFHTDFRRMVRSSKLVRFDLSDIKEMFRMAAGSDYPILKQYDSAQPFTPEDVRKAWLRVLPRLVVGI